MQYLRSLLHLPCLVAVQRVAGSFRNRSSRVQASRPAACDTVQAQPLGAQFRTLVIVKNLVMLLSLPHRPESFQPFRRASPPKALSSSSPAASAPAIACLEPCDCSSCRSIIFILCTRALLGVADPPMLPLFGSKIFSSLSNHPGATLLFSANSCSFKLLSQSLIVCSASSCAFCMCACNVWHEAMISSGDAACPEGEMTYFSRSVPEGSTVDEGGRVEGRGL